VGKYLLEGLKYYKDTQIKAYYMTKLNNELKSEKRHVQAYRNKTVYNTVVFCWRRSIATGSTALTLYLDLSGIGKLYLMLREG